MRCDPFLEYINYFLLLPHLPPPSSSSPSSSHHLLLLPPPSSSPSSSFFLLLLPPLPPQEKKLYEKIGEPTEVALLVLAEKLNLLGLDRSTMNGQQNSCASSKACQKEYLKDFTLEFSRDRKSMSVYCKPKGEEKPRPLMFVKVDY